MRQIGWISILILGISWAYLDLYGIPSNDTIASVIQTPNKTKDKIDPLFQPVEAGYVPGKSPDAPKAEAHIVSVLQNLPDPGPVEITSRKIISTPRNDGTWTEEWVAVKGSTEIPIQIDFGVR